MNIELGIGIGESSLMALSSSDRLIAFAWATAMNPSVSTSSVIHATVNAVLANSAGSALSPTVASAGNYMVSSVIANANGNVLVPSVAIAGSISINAVVASSNSNGIVPVVSTIRNVSVSGVVANSTGSAGVPTVTAGSGATTIVSDTFNRANTTLSATGLGNAETGQTWVTSKLNNSGTSTWGISSNQANGSGADAIAFIDSGLSDCSVQVNFASLNSSPQIVFRRNTNNCFYIECGSAYQLYRYNAGTFTNLASLGAGAAGDIIKVVLQGSTITVYKNGAQLGSPITDTFNQTATQHGMGIGNSNILMDDFLVQTL